MSPLVFSQIVSTKAADQHVADTLVWQIQHALNRPCIREHKFSPLRKWRFDIVVCDSQGQIQTVKLAVEIEGGIFANKGAGGRHNRGAGMKADLEKYNEAALLGWTVFRILPEWVPSGRALGWIEQCLKRRGMLL